MEIIKEKKDQNNKLSIINLIPEVAIDVHKNEIIKGLTSEQKFISSKYFYDHKGSELFEEITRLEEYYPTRTEMSILESVASKITKDLSNYTIIELGSGDCSKISVLLNNLSKKQLKTITYIPVDVSRSAIENSAECLSEKFPKLRIKAVVADFMHQLDLIPKTQRKLICFFGSTIGNLNRDQAQNFIKNISRIMNPSDRFLLGLDMVKDKTILENAYNDSKQITAAFNKNILHVVNEKIDSDFEPNLFNHTAFYSKEQRRIEMHLKAKVAMTITYNSNVDEIIIKKGEMIHTENSHKFDDTDIQKIGLQAGLHTEEVHTDTNKWFSLVSYKKV